MVLTLIIMGVTVFGGRSFAVLLLSLLAMGGFGTYLVLRIPTLPAASASLPAISVPAMS